MKSLYRYAVDDMVITNQLRLFITLSLFSFISWIILKGLYHPELFHGINRNLKSTKSLVAFKKRKTKNSSVEPKDIETLDLIAQLRKFMEEQKPYLNPQLTIKDLADAFEVPVKDLSILINHSLNQNFYDFVNEYRVREVMTLLENPSYRKLTILEILYEVGFNTKSTFNLAFKKYTQVTPTSYRKIHQ